MGERFLSFSCYLYMVGFRGCTQRPWLMKSLHMGGKDKLQAVRCLVPEVTCFTSAYKSLAPCSSNMPRRKRTRNIAEQTLHLDTMVFHNTLRKLFYHLSAMPHTLPCSRKSDSQSERKFVHGAEEDPSLILCSCSAV